MIGEQDTRDPPARDPRETDELSEADSGDRSGKPASGDEPPSCCETSEEQAHWMRTRGTTHSRWYRSLVVNAFFPLTLMPIFAASLFQLARMLVTGAEAQNIALVLVFGADVLASALLITLRASMEPTLWRYGGTFAFLALYSAGVHGFFHSYFF